MPDEPVTLGLLSHLLNRLPATSSSQGGDLRDLRHRQIRVERVMHEMQRAMLDRDEAENDRFGWLSAGPLAGQEVSRSDIRLKAGSGRNPTSRFRAADRGKPPWHLSQCGGSHFVSEGGTTTLRLPTLGQKWCWTLRIDRRTQGDTRHASHGLAHGSPEVRHAALMCPWGLPGYDPAAPSAYLRPTSACLSSRYGIIAKGSAPVRSTGQPIWEGPHALGSMVSAQ
jgi:hypothetical protein